MRKAVNLICILMITGLLFAKEARHGLSTKFTDVILGGLNTGMVYSIKKEQKLPYEVINMTDKQTEVEVIVEVPGKKVLREGYEPVPDVSWVTVFPSNFKLEPGEQTDCDVIISIPENEEYANRHYQAMLVTQTVEVPDKRGVAISFALASRLRFSTGPTPQMALQEHRGKILEALKMDMTPLSLFIPEIPVGEKVVLDGFDISTLQLINRGREDYQIEFAIAEKAERYGLTTGYQPMPEEIEVKFKKKKVKSKPRSIEDVIMEIEIPDKEEYYGKNFAFVVIAKILWLDIPVDLYSRVYFKTKEK
ncbi:hypothetical protein ACFLUV_01365 [Elusimicrobiota bacterium]